MPARALGDPATITTTTMVCRSCDVTWRGSFDDECWSCSTATMVAQATPRTVRHPPVLVEAERLVG